MQQWSQQIKADVEAKVRVALLQARESEAIAKCLGTSDMTYPRTFERPLFGMSSVRLSNTDTCQEAHSSPSFIDMSASSSISEFVMLL